MIEHLQSLRRTIIFSSIAYIITVLCLLPFAKRLFTLTAQPLLIKLPGHLGLIATNIFSTFLTPLKLVLYLSLFILMPLFLTGLWKFISPGLYTREKKFVWPLVFLSCLLFYSGMCFAYLFVVPMVFNFFIAMTPSGVNLLPDMSHYLSFILKLCLAFGLGFQVPIITYGVIELGVVSIVQVSRARPYIIVSAFIIGMLLTPPDVISQVCLAVPLWFLFEFGLLLARCRCYQQAKHSPQ